MRETELRGASAQLVDETLLKRPSKFPGRNPENSHSLFEVFCNAPAPSLWTLPGSARATR